MSLECETETKAQYKYIMFQQFTALAVIYCIGLVSNILVKVTLVWKGEASVINKLLVTLAVWDSLFLGCLLGEGVSVRWERGSWLVIKNTGFVWTRLGCYVYDSDELCQIINAWEYLDWYASYIPTTTQFIFYTMASIFQLTSVYQTIVIASFRALAIIYPFQASKLCSGYRAIIATLICVILASCVHIPNVMSVPVLYDEWACWSGRNTSNFTKCVDQLAGTNIFYNALDWSPFFEVYYVLFYHVITFFLLPVVILLTLNIVMVRELRQGSPTDNRAAEEENKAVTKVVIGTVTVFLVTYIVKPLYIIDIFYFNGYIIKSFADRSCAAYIIVNVSAFILPSLNSVVNLFIYLILRKSFRQQFQCMFIKCNFHRHEALDQVPVTYVRN